MFHLTLYGIGQISLMHVMHKWWWMANIKMCIWDAKVVWPEWNLAETIFLREKAKKIAIPENSLTDMMLFQCAFLLLSHARLNSFRTLKNHFGGAFTKKCNRCSSHYSTSVLSHHNVLRVNQPCNCMNIFQKNDNKY